MAQFQNFGGKNSKLFIHRDNGTSYSWRDSTLGATMDCFYSTPEDYLVAQAWQEKNFAEAIGPSGKFCTEDRRVFWASFENSKGGFDLKRDWKMYYDSEEKYKRLCGIKKSMDPNNVLTPNAFSLGEPPKGSSGAAADATATKKPVGSARAVDDKKMTAKKTDYLKRVMEGTSVTATANGRNIV